MKALFLKNWNLMRILKFVMAVYVAYEGLQSKQYIFLPLAALFLYQSIWNISTCGTNGCEVKSRPKP